MTQANRLSRLSRRAAALLSLLTLVATPTLAVPTALASGDGGEPAPIPAGEPGGPGLAVRARKVLTATYEGDGFVDNATILVKDGKIERVGPTRTIDVPEGYEVLDVGERWVMPGMVDLHCHIAGTFDINDMVYLTNPGIRASTAVRPGDPKLDLGVAGGVTSVLFIPGSGTNVGGQGVLLKTGLDTYEEMEIRNPGSLKLAQAGNPERWLLRPGRTFMNFNTRNTFRRGVAYGKRWRDYEQGKGPKPERDLQFDVYRDLVAERAQISTHTQIYQVSSMTLDMIRGEFGLPVFIDHGTFDSWRHADRAQEMGVPAILGPRNLDVPSRGFIRWSGSNPERMQGVAAGYQSKGHKMIGFNTDSPVVPQEELSQQVAMGVRLGFDNSAMGGVRGVTIIPAMTVGIDHRVGSIEPGKDADLLVITGDPADGRTAVEKVLIEGQEIYDVDEDRRRW